MNDHPHGQARSGSTRHISSAKPIYNALTEHQESEINWKLQDLVIWLQTWKDRFLFEFKLEISEIALCVDWLHWRRMGHFRPGYNGFGLVGEIAVNQRYLHELEPWEHLGTLLHELLHVWQEVHGKPGKRNYHNKQYIEKAARYGLVVNERGYQEYESDSSFFRLLKVYGVHFPALPTPETHVVRPTKLKKWSCGCRPPVNVRVAIDDFHAKCLQCQQLFVRST